MHVSAKDISRFQQLMNKYDCQLISKKNTTSEERWHAYIYERGNGGKQCAIYDRARGIYLRLEKYDGNHKGVKVKIPPPKGKGFEHSNSNFKNNRGVCVIADDMAIAESVLAFYFENKGSVSPDICDNQSELDRKTELYIKNGLTGTPEGIKEPSKRSGMSSGYCRDATVASWIIINSQGICECCGKTGPFFSAKTGMPYLEVHHVKYLSNEGSDRITNAVAACPSCHREIHFGVNGDALTKLLYTKVRRLVRE